MQTLPAVLWAMRTATSSTRGASPYELMFGRQPTSSSDLLIWAKADPETKVQDYLIQKRRKNELAQASAQANLQKQINRQRQYYIDNERVFKTGDWVYLFTPTNTSEDSEKLNTFWTGPWKIASRLTPTTYKLEQMPGKFAGRSFKSPTVQVNRLKIVQWRPGGNPSCPLPTRSTRQRPIQGKLSLQTKASCDQGNENFWGHRENRPRWQSTDSSLEIACKPRDSGTWSS